MAPARRWRPDQVILSGCAIPYAAPGLRNSDRQRARRERGTTMLPHQASPDTSTVRITGRFELVLGLTLT
jgi:hypothetical protein